MDGRYRIRTKSAIESDLDLVELVRLDEGVGSGDGLPADRLEVEGATMLLRVPVGPAVGRPAPAREPRQPHPLAARRAPARLRGRRRGRRTPHLSGRTREGNGGDGGRGGGGARRGRGGREGFLHGDLGGRGLLLLEAVVAIAFGTEVERRRAAKEATVVRAKAVPLLASLLFRHLDEIDLWNADLHHEQRKKQINTQIIDL